MQVESLTEFALPVSRALGLRCMQRAH